MLILKKIKLKKYGGFSLMETLVSIALFGMLSIMLSNIIISMSKFSYENDIRNNVVAELDSAATKLKNDLRGHEFGTCKDVNKRYLYKVVQESSEVEYILKIDSEGQLAWLKKVGGKSDTNSCKTLSGNSSNADQILTSNSVLTISDIKINFVNDDNANVAEQNVLTYVSISSCDTEKKLYDCTDTESYTYYFAISSRPNQS